MICRQARNRLQTAVQRLADRCATSCRQACKILHSASQYLCSKWRCRTTCYIFRLPSVINRLCKPFGSTPISGSIFPRHSPLCFRERREKTATILVLMRPLLSGLMTDWGINMLHPDVAIMGGKLHHTTVLSKCMSTLLNERSVTRVCKFRAALFGGLAICL